jgi:hypothetical protein
VYRDAARCGQVSQHHSGHSQGHLEQGGELGDRMGSGAEPENRAVFCRGHRVGWSTSRRDQGLHHEVDGRCGSSPGPEVRPHQVAGLFGRVPVSLVDPVRLGHRQGDVWRRDGLLLTGWALYAGGVRGLLVGVLLVSLRDLMQPLATDVAPMVQDRRQPDTGQVDFGAEEAPKIKQPVLFLSGAESLPMFIESRDRPVATASPVRCRFTSRALGRSAW